MASPSCPICAGRGTLTLGALRRRYPPASLALAVTYALEMCATIDMRAPKTDYTAWLLAARHNLRVTVNRCARAGLLAPRAPADDTPPVIAARQPPPDPPEFIAALAHAATGLADSPGVHHRLSAPPVPMNVTSVPVDGAHPGFSNGGSIANFAIIADPVAPLDRDTHPTRTDQVRIGVALGKGMFPEGETP